MKTPYLIKVTGEIAETTPQNRKIFTVGEFEILVGKDFHMIGINTEEVMVFSPHSEIVNEKATAKLKKLYPQSNDKIYGDVLIVSIAFLRELPDTEDSENNSNESNEQNDVDKPLGRIERVTTEPSENQNNDK